VTDNRKEPRWVNRSIVRAIHVDQVRKHGGSHGLRDEGLLESALERPRNRWRYEPESDLARIAAAYGYGLARNNPFVDGNKRVAFQTMYVFLGLNGYRIEAAETEVVTLVLGLAAGDVGEESLANWLRDHMRGRYD
jgi:death-on-curing protein